MKKASSSRKTTIGTEPFDMADYLRTPEDQAEYLNAWLEQSPEDMEGFARALGDVARARGMSKIARDTGLSRESLYKALSPSGNPSFVTVLRVSSALNLRLRVAAKEPIPAYGRRASHTARKRSGAAATKSGR